MRKILIIEDELILAADLQELLQQLNFQVDLAHNYNDAVRIAQLLKPDLLLCDINLNGDKNGIDLVKELRLIQTDFEVIYLTAYSSEDIISKAELTAPFNYLVKPYNDSQIEIAVRLAFNFIHQKSVNPNWAEKLTHMEIKILELVAQQKTSKEIAQLLFISDKTVRNHRYNVAKKLGIPSGNNSLSRWAIAHFKTSF